MIRVPALALLTLALTCQISMAQSAQGVPKEVPAKPAQETSSNIGHETMKKLDFLAGKWTGSGWIMLGPQKREEFNQTESVRSRLNGTILTIDGEGRSKTDNRPVHNAFGIIYFDAQAAAPRFHAFLADGKSIIADMKIKDDGFIWGFKAPFGEIRYTMTHSAPNEWTEIGERSIDDKTWTKFYEMKLTKEAAGETAGY